jgi:hypothetical protein
MSAKVVKTNSPCLVHLLRVKTNSPCLVHLSIFYMAASDFQRCHRPCYNSCNCIRETNGSFATEPNLPVATLLNLRLQAGCASGWNSCVWENLRVFASAWNRPAWPKTAWAWPPPSFNFPLIKLKPLHCVLRLRNAKHGILSQKCVSHTTWSLLKIKAMS